MRVWRPSPRQTRKTPPDPRSVATRVRRTPAATEWIPTVSRKCRSVSDPPHHVETAACKRKRIRLAARLALLEESPDLYFEEYPEDAAITPLEWATLLAWLYPDEYAESAPPVAAAEAERTPAIVSVYSLRLGRRCPGKRGRQEYPDRVGLFHPGDSWRPENKSARRAVVSLAEKALNGREVREEEFLYTVHEGEEPARDDRRKPAGEPPPRQFFAGEVFRRWRALCAELPLLRDGFGDEDELGAAEAEDELRRTAEAALATEKGVTV